METHKIRDLVAEHMVPAAPLAQALTIVADALDALARGVDALTERVEALEAEVLPRDPQSAAGGTPVASGRTA